MFLFDECVLPLSMQDINAELFQNGSFLIPSFFDYLPIENLLIMNSQVKPIGCNIKYHDIPPYNK